MNIKRLKEIIDTLGVSADYFMQTNGKLLNKIEPEYLNRFKRILVSIDGNREKTDFNQGKGTYEKVISNLKYIKENGFIGGIVARITILPSDFPIYLLEQIEHLFTLNLFDSVHWQLDMGFYKSDFNKEKISEFVEKYNAEVDS